MEHADTHRWLTLRAEEGAAMQPSPADDFDVIAVTLLNDPDADVLSVGDGLAVRGVVFARLDGPRLAVLLPGARARDLVTRGVARELPAKGRQTGAWVLVSDRSTWAELAAEAHQFAGEPAVGADS